MITLVLLTLGTWHLSRVARRRGRSSRWGYLLPVMWLVGGLIGGLLGLLLTLNPIVAMVTGALAGWLGGLVAAAVVYRLRRPGERPAEELSGARAATA